MRAVDASKTMLSAFQTGVAAVAEGGGTVDGVVAISAG